MKKIFLLITFLLTFALNIPVAFAAGTASISVSKSSIEKGSSVTASVTVKNTAAWNISLNSSGSTSGCSQKFVGDSGTGTNTSKTFSITCKSTSTGIINFTMSGDITSSDGTNTKLSGSKSVTVVTPREKSKNNKLKSLSITDYEISPAFNESTNEYSVNVPSTVSKITINATKADSYSSISGTGEKEVSEGSNVFDIIVTSETGVSNTYKLTVNVADQNPIEVTVDKVKYTVVKEAKNLTKPDLFDETTIKIKEFDIPAFKNEVCKYTLVGLKDEAGKISLFIYNDGKYTKFNEFISNRLSIVFIQNDKIPANFKKATLTINEQKIEGYQYNGDTIVYGLNLETGKKNYYRYDLVEKTLQIFDADNYEKVFKEGQKQELIIYILGGLSLLLFLTIILLLFKNKKNLNNLKTKINKSND